MSQEMNKEVSKLRYLNKLKYLNVRWDRGHVQKCIEKETNMSQEAGKEKVKRTALTLYGLYGLWVCVLIVVAIYWSIAKQYPLQRGLAYQWARCEQSGDAKQLADCLDVVISNMEAVGMVDGHDQFFFQSPITDIRQGYETTIIIADRARAVAQNTELYSLEHQYGMTELMEQLDRVEIGSRGWAFVNLWPVLGFYLRIVGPWGLLLGWLIPVVYSLITEPWW